MYVRGCNNPNPTLLPFVVNHLPCLMAIFQKSLSLTKRLVDFVYLLFQWHLKGNPSLPYQSCPPEMSYELQAECGEYAWEMAYAYHKRGKQPSYNGVPSHPMSSLTCRISSYGLGCGTILSACRDLPFWPQQEPGSTALEAISSPWRYTDRGRLHTHRPSWEDNMLVPSHFVDCQPTGEASETLIR